MLLHLLHIRYLPFALIYFLAIFHPIIPVTAFYNPVWGQVYGRILYLGSSFYMLGSSIGSSFICRGQVWGRVLYLGSSMGSSFICWGQVWGRVLYQCFFIEFLVIFGVEFYIPNPTYIKLDPDQLYKTQPWPWVWGWGGRVLVMAYVSHDNDFKLNLFFPSWKVHKYLEKFSQHPFLISGGNF